MKRRRSRNQLELWPVTACPVTARAPSLLSRATAVRGARGKSIEAPAPKPWLCVLLAVDTARRSGHALYDAGQLYHSGEVDTLDEATLEIIVSNAVGLAADRKLPCVLVLEAPYGGSVTVVTALGVARERWLRAWRNANQSIGHVVRVQPNQWRGPVLGGEWVSVTRDAVRAQEMLIARAFIERNRPPGAARMLGPDEAAAVLIGRWASHAAAVGVAIGKRAAKASLRAWTQPKGSNDGKRGRGEP